MKNFYLFIICFILANILIIMSVNNYKSNDRWILVSYTCENKVIWSVNITNTKLDELIDVIYEIVPWTKCSITNIY